MGQNFPVPQNSVATVGKSCNHFVPQVFICKMVTLLLLWDGREYCEDKPVSTWDVMGYCN